MLSLYFYPVSTQVDTDDMYVVVYRADDGQTLRSYRWMDWHEAWNLHTIDLLEFAGQRIRLQIGAYNDGSGATAVYVDDVELWVRLAP